MLYIVVDECMAYLEIGELVERAREEGHRVEICKGFKTSGDAIDKIRRLIGEAGAEPEETRIISNGATEFVAALVLGADFTWALDLY